MGKWLRHCKSLLARNELLIEQQYERISTSLTLLGVPSSSAKALFGTQLPRPGGHLQSEQSLGMMGILGLTAHWSESSPDSPKDPRIGKYIPSLHGPLQGAALTYNEGTLIFCGQ